MKQKSDWKRITLLRKTSFKKEIKNIGRLLSTIRELFRVAARIEMPRAVISTESVFCPSGLLPIARQMVKASVLRPSRPTPLLTDYLPQLCYAIAPVSFVHPSLRRKDKQTFPTVPKAGRVRSEGRIPSRAKRFGLEPPSMSLRALDRTALCRPGSSARSSLRRLKLSTWGRRPENS